MMDKMTGRSRGFGFVMFAVKRDQDAAIEKMHNTEVEGRRISVTRAVPQAETAPGTPADALRKGQYVPRDMGRQGGYGGRWVLDAGRQWWWQRSCGPGTEQPRAGQPYDCLPPRRPLS